jgi:putative Holliday junction resolvase
MSMTDASGCLRTIAVLLTLLGFDFGLHRIGVAIGQQLTGTARALVTVRSRSGKPDWDMITALIRTWQPDALVVGLPVHADGTDSEFTRRVKRFIRQLEDRYKLPVHAMDERLSSHAAAHSEDSGRHELKSMGIDAVAAKEILQSWLQSEHE